MEFKVYASGKIQYEVYAYCDNEGREMIDEFKTKEELAEFRNHVKEFLGELDGFISEGNEP